MTKPVCSHKNKINIPYLTWITSLAEANLPLGSRAPHFLSRTWRQCAVWPGLEP